VEGKDEREERTREERGDGRRGEEKNLPGRMRIAFCCLFNV
jgi:hypothetical protein